jgi:hypothetical protein
MENHFQEVVLLRNHLELDNSANSCAPFVLTGSLRHQTSRSSSDGDEGYSRQRNIYRMSCRRKLGDEG